MAADESQLLARERNVNTNENMSIQQLESVFTTPSPPATAPRPKKRSPTLAPRPVWKPTPEKLILAPRTEKATPMSEFEKIEMVNNKPLAENAWYDWCDWLVNHIPGSVKKSLKDAKEKKSWSFLKQN